MSAARKPSRKPREVFAQSEGRLSGPSVEGVIDMAKKRPLVIEAESPESLGAVTGYGVGETLVEVASQAGCSQSTAGLPDFPG